MPQLFPTKLPVPTQSGVFEFSALRQMTIQDFKDHVLENSEGKLSKFDLIASEGAQIKTMDDLTQQKFQMQVDSTTYDVYPDIRSITSPLTV